MQVNLTEHEVYKTAIRNFLVAEAPDIAIWFAGHSMKFFIDQGLFLDVSDAFDSFELRCCSILGTIIFFLLIFIQDSYFRGYFLIHDYVPSKAIMCLLRRLLPIKW